MSTNPKFEFQGIDHIALVCSDMAATVDFYHRKLGMPVLHTLEYFDDSGKLLGQHWFFGVGDLGNKNAHIAIFWFRDGFQTLPTPSKPVPPKGAAPFAQPVGSLLHLNLRVSAERMREYADKLKSEGIDYRHSTRYFDPVNPEIMKVITTHNQYHQPEDQALMNSIYFHDPDGNYLEFNTWTLQWDSWPNTHIPCNDQLAQARDR